MGRQSWDRQSWDRQSWDRQSWDRQSWDRQSWDRQSWEKQSWDRQSWDRQSWDRQSWDSTRDSWDSKYKSWDTISKSWDGTKKELCDGTRRSWEALNAQLKAKGPGRTIKKRKIHFIKITNWRFILLKRIRNIFRNFIRRIEICEYEYCRLKKL